jgi:type III restriction enzyme
MRGLRTIISGLKVLYVFKGVVHKYRPDFIIRLKTGFLVLETKGQDTDQDKTKRGFWMSGLRP